MVALVEHEGADLAQQHALLAAAGGVDDRLAVVAALGHPEAVHGRLQALGVVAGDLRLQALGLLLQDGGDRIVNGGGNDADARARRRSAGAMNCQADIPAARETTSSSRRDRPRKQDIAPISTQNGRIRSPICGTRNSEILATSNAETFGIVADAPHLLDVVEQDDQREDAQQHRHQRGEEAHAEIAVRGC